MIKKDQQKENAISLRKKGLSYRDILAKVPVAKSTLSLWLRDVGLSKQQKQNLTQKRLEAARRGALMRKNERILVSDDIRKKAITEVPKLLNKDLWLMGVMLYWAEGSKQKTYNISQGVTFANSDKNMVRLFVQWLRQAVGVPANQVFFEVYIHESGSKEKALNYWANELKVPASQFTGVYVKKDKVNSKRKNVGECYHGLVRVKVRKSTGLNRKISGWIEGVIKNCPIV